MSAAAPGDGDRAWPSPAKLNLFLHVTGRRADGYHELQTLFRLVDWGDTVHISLRGDGRIRRSRPLDGIDEARDLSLRAARALQAACPGVPGADIGVDKRIPTGAGLGGGSSNAATVLLALNHLWNTRLEADRLADIALELGADVPVFVRGRSAWAEGVGERLQAVDLPARWYLIVMPDCHIETRAIFSAPELPRAHPAVSFRDYLDGRCGNDCESVARARFSLLDRTFRWFEAAGLPIRLSGTGASVFVEFEEEKQAEDCRRRLPSSWRSVVARGLDSSPLCALTA